MNSINKRELQYLLRRITQKELARELGVSTSTIYRWKTAKKPIKAKRISSHEIIELKTVLKSVKVAHSVKEKQKVSIEKINGRLVRTREFAKTNTTNYYYHFNSPDIDLIKEKMEQLISDEVWEGNNINHFGIQLNGLDAYGNKISFSTKFLAITDSDGQYLLKNYDFLFENLQGLLNTPSTQFKVFLGLDLIQKDYNI